MRARAELGEGRFWVCDGGAGWEEGVWGLWGGRVGGKGE